MFFSPYLIIFYSQKMKSEKKITRSLNPSTPKLEKLCNCSISKKCQMKKMSADDIATLSKNFNQHTSILEQDIFLSTKIIHSINKRGRTYCPIYYYVDTSSNKKIRICKISFLAIFGIGHRRLNSINRKLRKKIINLGSNRGGSHRQGKFVVLEKKITQHISSYNTTISHYNRNKDSSDKRYLSPNLTIKQMHEDFNKKSPESSTYGFYYNIFKTKFNLSFKKPSVDICDKCNNLTNKLNNNQLKMSEKRNLKEELNNHIARGNSFYTELRKELPSNTIKLSFDMMQLLPLPLARTNKSYYSHQIWLYCMGIVNLVDGKELPTFYFWSELQSKRGSNQISSIVFNQIKLAIAQNKSSIELFCDSCPGQNRNHILMSCLLYCSVLYQIQIKITFPERGHSFMPPDRAFGRAERIKRRETEINLPKEYFEIFQKVGEVRVYKDDFSFFDWYDNTKFLMKDIVGFRISKVKQVIFKNGKIGYSEEYSGKYSWVSIANISSMVQKIRLQKLEDQNCVSEHKMKDVQALVKSLGIDYRCDIREFYKLHK